MGHMQDPSFFLGGIHGARAYQSFFLVEIIGHMEIPSFLLDKIQGLSLKVRESMWSILLLQ
jgi:hypothetical protein